MANPYKDADKKKKTPPGGLHTEEKNEQTFEVKPAVEENVAAEETPNLETAPVVEQKEVVAEQKKIEPVSEISTLASIYEDKRRGALEPRSVRIQAVVTQSTAAKLDALANAHIIKSRNDLINFLIESYMETLPKDLFDELLRKS